jgi:hypothetical protein
VPAWNGTAVVKVCEGIAAAVSVHAGCPGTEENLIACNFGGGVGVNCGAIFEALAGEEYFIRVAGFEDTAGQFEIELKAPDCLLNANDANANGVPDECECLADVNGDGQVDAADVAQVLASFGVCESCPEDVDGSGVVDEADVILVLKALGPCPIFDGELAADS